MMGMMTIWHNFLFTKVGNQTFNGDWFDMGAYDGAGEKFSPGGVITLAFTD